MIVNALLGDTCRCKVEQWKHNPGILGHKSYSTWLCVRKKNIAIVEPKLYAHFLNVFLKKKKSLFDCHMKELIKQQFIHYVKH